MKLDIEKTIREILANIRDEFDFSETSVDADFGDVGLDSLDTASLLLEVQEKFDVNISDDDAEELNTIAKVAAFIRANKG